MKTRRPTSQALRRRILAIEHELDKGAYRPGPWAALLEELRTRPGPVRSALGDDLSRVSRKLHLKSGVKTFPLGTGVILELLAACVGGSLIALAVASASNLAAILGATLWVASFEPLIKVAQGRVLGIGFDYAYLYYGEPRFKMRYGSYAAAPRWKRVWFHLAGAVGSPCGALLARVLVRDRLNLAAGFCLWAFWITVAINLAALAAGLLGARRVGPLRLALTSGGAAGLELRAS